MCRNLLPPQLSLRYLPVVVGQLPTGHHVSLMGVTPSLHSRRLDKRQYPMMHDNRVTAKQNAAPNV